MLDRPAASTACRSCRTPRSPCCIGAEPGVVLGVDGRSESSYLHSAAGESGWAGRKRLAVGIEFGGVALPEAVRPLPANSEIVRGPEVAFAVERGAAARAIAAAAEFERQHPGARRTIEVGYERRLAHVPALRDRIKLAKQGEQPLGLVPGSARDRLRRGQSVGWRIALGARRC